MAVDNDIISVFDVNHMHEMKPTSHFATFTPYITIGWRIEARYYNATMPYIPLFSLGCMKDLLRKHFTEEYVFEKFAREGKMWKFPWQFFLMAP